MVAQNTLRRCIGIQVFLKMNFKLAVDVNKCPAQITLPNALHTCASYSKLPYDISISGIDPIKIKGIKKSNRSRGVYRISGWTLIKANQSLSLD